MPDKELSMEQTAAVNLCCDLQERIVGVTGGAGTGKTLVLGEAYKALTSDNHSAVLCAPTGRAAKRIEELSGIPAKTIHRLLEFPTPEELMQDGERVLVPGEPRRDQSNPLLQEVVFVDESSMLAPTLYRQLMNACSRRTVVRFFGDNNQLPPVEEGTPPFFMILDKYPSITLSFNYRSNDALVSNAMQILQGRMPSRGPQFELIFKDDPISFLINFITKDFMDDSHQIIIPARKGERGTNRVNTSLQLKLNGKGDYLRLDRFNDKEAQLLVRSGDKFLWTKNDYQLNLFNGEIGTIESLDPEGGSISLGTPERRVEVPPTIRTYSPYHGSFISYDPRRQLDLGYAVTVHKAQGSEFDTVVIGLSTRGHYPLLDRRLLYTAITRAKNRVILILDRSAMKLALRRAQV